jgi:uncharacterized protein YgiM (DUF1202 family)
MKLGQRFLLLLALSTAVLFAACRRGHGRPGEPAYVSAPQVILRDRVAAVYNKVGTVKNGERVEILDRDRRFAKIRTTGQTEGWMEQRYLVTQEVYDGFQKLTQQTQNDPVQAAAVTRNDTNLHLEPGRDTEHLYQLDQSTKISLLKRASVEKNLPGASSKPADSKLPGGAAPSVPMEDWWLIRDPQAHVGWLLGRMMDVDVPLDVAQYAEGQRIVATFVLNEVQDADKKVPQYLMLVTEPKDGMPFDFNQLRVFTWNVKRHRYETAYRERGLNGILPATISQENFDKEGTLPVFVVRVKDDSGNTLERKYKLNTPIVRRVLAPGEELPKAAPRSRRRRR